MATDQDWEQLLTGHEIDPGHPVQFDAADPGKTMRYEWAVEYIQRQYRTSPARFANKLAEVVADWSVRTRSEG